MIALIHAVAPAPTLQVTQCARHDSEMHERRSNTRELPSPPALLLVTGPALLMPIAEYLLMELLQETMLVEARSISIRLMSSCQTSACITCPVPTCLAYYEA